MNRLFNCHFSEVVVAVALSCLVAGGVAALSSSGNGTEFAISVSVNRINEGDRLPSDTVLTQRYNNAFSAKTIERKQRLGCDQAFSPIADQMRANIFRRCMV